MIRYLTFLLLIGWSSPAQIAYGQTTIQPIPRRTLFFDTSGMDRSVIPGNDFYAFANGNWLKKTKIPDDQVAWGVFEQLYEENLPKIKNILEAAAIAEPTTGHIEQQVGDFYAGGMDTSSINKLGYQPLKAELAQISTLTDFRQVAEYLVTDESHGRPLMRPGSAFIGYTISNDSRQSTIKRIKFRQAGLSLPEKGYYTRTDAAAQKIRTGFLAYITRLFTLIGTDSVTARIKAETILAFETRLAESHKTPAELRDPIANYHKVAVADLNRQMPNLNWRGLLNRMELRRIDTVLVAQLGYYQAIDTLLPATPISLLRDRLTLDLLTYNAPLLSREFVEARFNFYDKTLSGQPRPPDRWKYIAGQTDAELGDALGQLWVKKYFPPEAKKRMLVLVNNIQQVYRARIQKLDWMSAETKAVALTKLTKLVKKIGYPDQWKDYSGLLIKREDYYGNVQRTRKYWIQQELAKVNHPVNRLEWGMSPPTVNAYANASNNEIVFAAGVLQFPFFDKDADEAINYGAIGAVIGHEMTHLFDDHGRKYDANGNLRDWWTKQDAEHFMNKSQVLVTQYNDYTVLDSMHVNGQLTLGENLADLGGLALAYQAFKLTKQGKGMTKIDGFTPDQRFFLGYAQLWRCKIREETARAWLTTDSHSPEKYRVNGTLTNFFPFYKSFQVKPGQRLYKPHVDRVGIW